MAIPCLAELLKIPHSTTLKQLPDWRITIGRRAPTERVSGVMTMLVGNL
jgi:hypothetical protein